jgi:DNA-binding CsgD family transcriptional regulator/N-acetylneuraminic acid mutarotase
MTSPEQSELSERELEILRLVATGAGNKEIAQKLFISSNTVKVHLRNIFNKIGVTSRTEAAMYAVRAGLVENLENPSIVEGVEEIDTDLDEHAKGSKILSGDTRQAKRWIMSFSFWVPFFLIAGLIGLIILVWSLNQGFAFSSTPTTIFTSPQNTSTPIPHWNKLVPLPSARSNLALIAYGNQTYAIGGLNSQGVSGEVHRFEPQTNSWISLSSKPKAVFDICGAVINGQIYIPGGRYNLNSQQPTNIMEIFDPSTNQWRTSSPLPIPLSGYGLVAYEGILYIFGGWDGTNYRNSVFSYDPVLEEWLERTPMPSARAFPGAAEAAGKIYVIGGINNNQSVTANEIYTPSRDHDGQNPWEAGFPLPENRLAVQATTIADTIYVFGGEILHSNRIGLIYFPQTDVWQSLEPSPAPLGDNFGMTSIGTNLFFVGGNYGTVFSDQNTTYQAIITLSIPIIIK